jgi:hypothetical protein
MPPFSPSEFDVEELSLSGEYYPEQDNMGRTPPRTRIARNMKDKRSRVGADYNEKGSRLVSRVESSKARRKSVAEYSPAKDVADSQEGEFC